MPSTKILEKYARLAVVVGANVQKGQLLVIRSSVDSAYFARLCQKAAYEAGASEVIIRYHDEEATRIQYLYAKEKVLKEVPQSSKLQREEEQSRKCAYLHIDSEIPGIYKDCDSKKIANINKAVSKEMKPYQSYTMNSKGQWTIVAVPNEKWAKQVFPEESTDTAMEKLWKAILKASRVTATNDPVKEWKDHSKELRNHCNILNAYDFKELHFKNDSGTDLVVGLAEGHIWGGGSEAAHDIGVEFEPNIPTEEVFTTPDRKGVNGTVHSSRPLSLNGILAEDFTLTFENGKVVGVKAKKGQKALEELLKSDANAKYLGEVALISNKSPISDMNLLFYNTLFDENASCHLALGASYPSQIKGGDTMSEKELISHHANVSGIHVDFMFGTKDMEVVGIQKDGKCIPVFKKGNFVF